MADDTTTEIDYQDYLDDLARALRTRGVDNDRIDDIIEDVSFHMVSTGEPPYETYGLPNEYADEVASTEPVPKKKERRSLSMPSMPQGLKSQGLKPQGLTSQGLTSKLPEGIDPVAPVVGLFGGAFLAGGALALGSGDGWLFGLPAFLGLVVGLALGIYALFRALPDSFRDPETGETSVGEHSRPAMIPAIFLAVLTVGLVLVGAIAA